VVQVYSHTKLDGNLKNFLWMYGRVDGRTPEFQSTRSVEGNDLKMEKTIKE